ncbi:MAG: hypothetical protein JSS48_03985 [Nitrospira sp.]|nr:hypothetical protein [Nitrospira sp.]
MKELSKLAGNRRRARRPRLLHLLARGIVIVPLLALGGGGYVIWRTMEAEAASALEFRVQIAARDASQGFAAGLLALWETDRLTRNMTDTDVSERAPDMRRRFVEMTTDLPQVSDLFILDGDRTLIRIKSDSLPLPDAVQFNSVPAVAADAPRFFVSPGVAATSGQEVVFGLLLPRSGVTPGLRRVLGITTRSLYFEKRWLEMGLIDRDAGVSMSLVYADGRVLLGRPAIQSSSDPAFLAALRDNAQDGVYHRHVLNQNDAQITAYRRLDQFPVYVVGSLTHYAVIRKFVVGMLPHLFFSFTGALVVACLRLTRRRA